MEILLPLCFLRLLFIAGLLAWDNDDFYKSTGTLFLSLMSKWRQMKEKPLIPKLMGKILGPTDSCTTLMFNF